MSDKTDARGKPYSPVLYVATVSCAPPGFEYRVVDTPPHGRTSDTLRERSQEAHHPGREFDLPSGRQCKLSRDMSDQG